MLALPLNQAVCEARQVEGVQVLLISVCRPQADIENGGGNVGQEVKVTARSVAITDHLL